MYSRSTGEVNSNRVTSSLLRKRTRLPTHAHEVGALTFEVTDNFGSNVVLPCGAYGPWCICRLQELLGHPGPGPAFQVVPRCNPSSLTPMGPRSRLNVWYKSLAFEGCVQYVFPVFGGSHLLLSAAWTVSTVVCCWWSQAMGSEGSV